MAEPRRTFTITDEHALSALAHPLRLRLLGLLPADGPATATRLAERRPWPRWTRWSPSRPARSALSC
jgi:hypothetical protein